MAHVSVPLFFGANFLYFINHNLGAVEGLRFEKMS